MAKAILKLRAKKAYASGEIIEMTIWQLPQPNPERPHGLKYSLYYGRDGQRIVSYDNERGKGDHCHILETEEKYVFTSVENLVADFFQSIEIVGGLK